MGDSYPVYLGLWTNWSYGAILGKTLTVTRANGALIIAFIAFFVAATGSQMWRILCFILHNIYSDSKPQDAVYHQRQAILRNSGSPVTGLWEFVLLIWAWRKTPNQSFAKLIPVSFMATLIACSLIVASGFSSRVALGDEVLIDGGECGIVSARRATLVDDYFLRIKPYYALKEEGIADYAQRCYTKDTEEAGCNTLVRRSLPITSNGSAECPFEKSLCLAENTNLLLDTGLLDSHLDLEINSPPNLRFQYRRTLHCAPLTTTGYKSNITDTLNRTYTRYMYGSWIVENIKFNCNCSYAVPTDVLRPTQKLLIEAASTGYKLELVFPNSFHLRSELVLMDISAVTAYSTNGTFDTDISSFIPIAEFSKTDVDLDLIFLTANTVAFVEKSEDLWYRATSPVKVRASAMQGDDATVTTTFWEADEPAWPMGCNTQHQFCNPSSSQENQCTKLSGFDDAIAYAETIFDPKSGLMHWFSRILDQAGSLSDLISTQGPKTLTSRFSLISKDVQARLKPNQWQIDVTSWFSHRLAALQMQVVSTASGPSRTNPELKEFVEGPQNEEEGQLCRNQVSEI
jgi:hypothetical protein